MRDDQCIARWVTFYDGPSHRLTITAIAPDGTRWSPLRVDDQRSKPGSWTVWSAAGSGDPLVIEVVLGENGFPLDPPPFLARAALGSPTVWPQEQNQYLWWLDESPITTDQAEFPNPWPDWSPTEPSGAARPIEPPSTMG